MDLLRIINSDEISEKTISNYIPRSVSQLEEIVDDVNKIINEVKLKGDTAIINFSKKFDGIDLNESEIQVTNDEMEAAYNKIDQKLLKALRFAKNNLIKFHESQKKDEWLIDIVDGVKAGQLYRPIELVGLYIPGGHAIYPSTVLMAATPAYVAGVKEIIICSPPQKDKRIAPEIIVAA
ncbi:MAG: histidinol dehydrogenase, partial [Promethearchaeota archaeon]